MRDYANEQSRRLLKRRLPIGLKAAFLFSACVLFLYFDTHTPYLNNLRNGLSLATQPLQIVAEVPADIAHFFQQRSNRPNLVKENASLKKDVTILQARLQKMAALQAENERIRTLLDSAQQSEQDFIIARILSVSPSPYQHTLMLNKGFLDGAYKGQPLIDANGIMGQIILAQPLDSRAMLITDANSAIPVEINRTGLRTIAKGTGNPGLLQLNFLPKSTDIKLGDLLVTSGLGGRYPAGYPVATVTQIQHPKGSEFLTISAEPVAKLDHGNNVLLMEHKRFSDPIANTSEPEL